MSNSEYQDSTRMTGIFARGEAPKVSRVQKQSMPPVLHRPRPRIDVAGVNTNVVLFEMYGKAKLDAYVAREQRELLGSAYLAEDEAPSDAPSQT